MSNLLGAMEAGRIIAVTVFAIQNTIADLLFNISLPEGRDATLHLSCGRELCALQTRGIPVLNMGGGVRQGDSIAQAKRHYGARVLPLRCLKQVYLPDRFAELCRGAGVDPSDRAGYFPPYRAIRAS